MKYTFQELLDAEILKTRDKAIESGAIKHATPEFLQLVKEAEEWVKK